MITTIFADVTACWARYQRFVDAGVSEDDAANLLLGHMLRIPIVGQKHAEWLPDTLEGPLTLIPDPTNQHDRNAIGIWYAPPGQTSLRRIGWVPRDSTHKVHGLVHLLGLGDDGGLPKLTNGPKLSEFYVVDLPAKIANSTITTLMMRDFAVRPWAATLALDEHDVMDHPTKLKCLLGVEYSTAGAYVAAHRSVSLGFRQQIAALSGERDIVAAIRTTTPPWWWAEYSTQVIRDALMQQRELYGQHDPWFTKLVDMHQDRVMKARSKADVNWGVWEGVGRNALWRIINEVRNATLTSTPGESISYGGPGECDIARLWSHETRELEERVETRKLDGWVVDYEDGFAPIAQLIRPVPALAAQ